MNHIQSFKNSMNNSIENLEKSFLCVSLIYFYILQFYVLYLRLEYCVFFFFFVFLTPTRIFFFFFVFLTPTIQGHSVPGQFSLGRRTSGPGVFIDETVVDRCQWGPFRRLSSAESGLRLFFIYYLRFLIDDVVDFFSHVWSFVLLKKFTQL